MPAADAIMPATSSVLPDCVLQKRPTALAQTRLPRQPALNPSRAAKFKADIKAFASPARRTCGIRRKAAPADEAAFISARANPTCNAENAMAMAGSWTTCCCPRPLLQIITQPKPKATSIEEIAVNTAFLPLDSWVIDVNGATLE